jgi:hypothetical protein
LVVAARRDAEHTLRRAYVHVHASKLLGWRMAVQREWNDPIHG